MHRIWTGSPLPEHLAAYGETWARHYPDWGQRLWTDPDELPGWEHRDLYDQAEEIVPADAVGQFRADLMRVAILRRHGGLYVDTDTEALRPFDFDGLSEMAAWEDASWVGNTYIAAEPGHPILEALHTAIRPEVERLAPARPNILTGPHLLTPIWTALGGHVEPQPLWYPYSYRDVSRGRVRASYGRAYAVHHWQHRRDLTGRQR